MLAGDRKNVRAGLYTNRSRFLVAAITNIKRFQPTQKAAQLKRSRWADRSKANLMIEFKRLTEIDKSEIIELMNNPLVRRQMPLLKDVFGDKDCDEFIAAKERLWTDNGYGPWAFVVNGQFAGWGGLQPENGEPDLGLVLHPKYWGIGKTLYDEIIDRAFGEMGFETVTVLLPPTRKRIKGLLRLGFQIDGELMVGEERFIRYRLNKR